MLFIDSPPTKNWLNLDWVDFVANSSINSFRKLKLFGLWDCYPVAYNIDNGEEGSERREERFLYFPWQEYWPTLRFALVCSTNEKHLKPYCENIAGGDERKEKNNTMKWTLHTLHKLKKSAYGKPNVREKKNNWEGGGGSNLEVDWS